MINNIVKEGCIPDDWRKSILVPVYKGKGEQLVCGSYRDIKLFEFQRLPPARGGTAQRKIFHLANWSQHIHPGPSSSRSSFLWSRVSCTRQR